MAPKRSCCIPFSCCCFSSSSSSDGKRQVDHPTSAGAPSSPSATETDSVDSKRIEARKCEIEPVEAPASASPNKDPASASPNILQKAEDENVNVNKNVSGDPGYSETPPTASIEASKYYIHAKASTSVPSNAVPAPYQSDKAPASASDPNILQKSEDENVNVNKNVSGDPGYNETPPTASIEASKYDMHAKASTSVPSNAVPAASQSDKAPASASDPNILEKSEDENVNVNKNVSGNPGCNETPPTASREASKYDMRDEASTSVPSNVVPMKYLVDANLKAPAPSQSSNIPQKSEGANVDINQNVSGAPRCSTGSTPSSSSPTQQTKPDLLKAIQDQVEGKGVDVNLDELMDHISNLLKLREEEMQLRDKKASTTSKFSWPEGFKKLNDILSWGTDLKKFTELMSSGLDFASKLINIMSGPVKEFLEGIGQAGIATAGLLVVAYALERFDELSSNNKNCWDLIKEMSRLASVVKRWNESSKGTVDVIKDATALVVEGAIMCCTQLRRSAWKSFFRASKDKDDLSGIREKLKVTYNRISNEIGLRVLTDIERILAAIEPRNSPLSKKYPEHAVGIKESIEEVMKLLECENEKNVVTVILHGFGGIGKTTLADAVFSQVKGGKCSEVQLFDDVGSKPDIIQLQRKILKHLMEPGEVIPEIPKPEDGGRELGEILEKVEAFIYVDNVLDRFELERLLPKGLDKAKKVRFLLTARNKDVKEAFPSCTPTKIYPMEGIKNPEAALSILKNDIKSEDLDGSQLNKIIKICHGIPLLLELVARFIGHADDKGAAYSEVMQEEEKWNNESFNKMHLRFAYDALPEICKDPFLDICSYFKRWDWDTVENIVGKSELKMLESRALVTKDTFTGVVNVHDVILELGFHVSKGKEVRLSFTSARELKAYLEEEKEGAAEGIKGIWLTDNKDMLQISALTLDLMHNSLRVLQLGKLTEVEGKCSKIFEKLVFFEGKVSQLPFLDVSKLKQLRYLSYAPNELKLSKMPSSLRHMEFDGSSHSHAFQISSRDLQQHQHLRILRLLNFSELENLPEELGDQVKGLQELSLTNCISIKKLPKELGVQVKGLQELSLSNCKSIKKLPNSISKLPFLRILKMDNCSNLTELPVDFGSLSSLQELNLSGCEQLEALPESFDKLSSLKLLNLSNCKRLLNLPQGLGKLTCLVELNIEYCKRLQSIPDSIGELKLLRALDLEYCSTLKELPDGFCNLSSITTLSFKDCSSLEKLPDGFGQLKSLKVLDMRGSETLQKLPEGFGQLKNLERLDLESCSQLRALCNDFHCLSSLQKLDLTSCKRLEKLPENFHFLTSLQSLDLSHCKGLEKLPLYFHCLKSLQFLYLVSCPKLEGKSMDHVAKMNTLQVVVIIESNELVKRWAEIQSECHGSSYPSVIISEEKPTISDNVKENMKNSVLSELDSLLTNGRGEPVHLSDLLPNTSTLLIFDVSTYKDEFPWPLIEETVDAGMQIKIIYIGPHFDQLPTKVKDTIFKVHLSNDRTADIGRKVVILIGTGCGDLMYVQMDAKMVGDGNSDNYGPSSCWRLLTDAELEEFVACNSGRYLRLKQLAETNEESNIKLLIELFAPDGDETTPVFQKYESSQKDRTENSEPKTTCGVDKLKGKTVLVEMWPYNSWRLEINYHQFWKEVYIMEKKKVDLEIISIPIVYPSKECDVIDVYKQFSREVPWLVLQNSWTVITRAVKFFFEKHGGWEERDEREKWYPTINWIIEPNGRISVYRPSIFLKEEWEQPSTLEFLFNHTLLESVSAKVQKLMLPGKLICLYRRREFLLDDDDDEVLYSIWNALDQQQRDRIHIIHLGRRKMKSFQFTNNIENDYYYPLKNTAEIGGMSSLNLSENEILRFSLRLCHLEKEINRMEDSELKFLLHSFQDEDAQMYGSIAFMDGSGKVVAALGGKILESIFDRKDRAERFIKSIMNDIEGGGGKEMHDEDPGVSDTLIQNLQTSSALDAYLDSLREYISERWEVEFYHPFRFKKEGEKRSLPRAWPTSTGFCRLKKFLSEGINDDWVKDVISRQKYNRTIVIHSLLMGIEAALWAVAGLLAVADILERFETISANRMDCLFLLDKMFRMAQNILQFNQKPGLWRGVKRVATAIILACSIDCCFQIDESKFAPFGKGNLSFAERRLTRICDTMAEAITEGPSNESGSLLEEMFHHFDGFRVFLRSGDEGGPSCEGESDVEGGSTTGTSGEEE